MNIIYNIYNKSKASLYVTTDKIFENLSYYFQDNDQIIYKNKNPKRINGNNSIYSNIETFNLPASKIDDNIYLGSSINAANYKELKDIGITCIINVTKAISNYYEDYEDEFDYYRISVEDIENESIINNLDLVYKYIDKQIKKNKKILIHCFAGRSRSAAVVLFYLIKKYKLNIKEAYDLILKKRHVVNINKSFYNEINNYFT